MASHLIWELVKKNNCYLMKRGQDVFSREPMNLKGKNCFTYSGLAHKKAIGIAPQRDGQGVVLSIKKTGCESKPGKSVHRTKHTKCRRRNLQIIRNMICRQKYRRELKMVALRRASGLMANMKPSVSSTSKPKKT